MSDVHERLRRMLFLVPYVAKHPGVSVDALAEAAGISRDELLKELDLLTCVGRPPFNPDDYVDIYVDNDRVYVDLDQRLSRPPRLTPAEAAALAASAELLRPAAGSTLEAALGKLERVLPAPARARYRELHQRIDAQLDAPPTLAPLTQAILERREVTFDYASPGRAGHEPRRVRPYELLSHRGQWYLQGWDHVRQDERLFRVDRMEGLAVTEARFEPPPGARARVPNPARADVKPVRVRFSKGVAPYVRERFGEDARLLADGGVEVRVAGDSERWLVQYVLSFAGEAEVLEPESAREAVARAARARLEA